MLRRASNPSQMVRMLLLLAIVTAAVCQNEDQPYFSLSSTRTFASGGRPTVQLGAWKIDSLEFRVYRINDAVKFYSQLDDPHQFGARTQRPSHNRTWIERIHSWKHNLRAGILRTLRGQFTEAPSDHLGFIAKTGAPLTKGTTYAEAPVLNPEQLVLTFNQPVHSTSRWDTQNVEVPVKEKGVYVVEAVNKDLRAYTILMVSDIVSVTKTGRDHMTAFIADRATGQAIPGAQVYTITARGGATPVGTTNGDGLVEFKAPTSLHEEDDVRVLARKDRDVAVSDFSGYIFASARDRLTGMIYTDRPVYRPGHTVHFKAILRLKAAVGYEIPSSQSVRVEVKDTDDKSIYQKTLTTTANGTVSDELTLGPDASLGDYTIELHSGESVANGTFGVEEYKKPEYEVRVTPSKPRVLEGETVPVTIDARYYFGEPVPGAKVKYGVYRSRYWFPMWYDPDQDASDNTDATDDPGSGGENEQIVDEEGTLDQDGKLTINVPTTVNEQKRDNVYRIEARVTDEANREISGHGFVVATYGSFVVNVTPNRYFVQGNSQVQFTVQAFDYDMKPVQARAHVELTPWTWQGDNSNNRPTSAADVTTGADGTARTEMNAPAQAGSYRVNVTAQAGSGRGVQDYSYIWVAGAGDFDWGGGDQKTVQIIPDKKTYHPGDTAKLLIITGKAGTNVWVSVEGRDLRASKVLRSAGSMVTYEVPVTANDEPNIFVSASFIRNGEIYQSTKKIRVPPDEHKLNIALNTDKPQYLPGETGTYNIAVTGSDGKPVSHADLSVGVVDEAIYAIRPDTTQS